MSVVVVALRGFAVIAVLTTLVGGIPRVVQAALAVTVGVWSGYLVVSAGIVDAVGAIGAGGAAGAAGAAGAGGAAGASGEAILDIGITAVVDAGVFAVAVRELAIGAAIGVLAAMPLLAARAAGRLVDVAGGSGDAQGPYGAFFGVLAAAVFVGIDGHVAVLTALVDSHTVTRSIAAAQPRVLTAIAELVPAAVRLAVPWLVTAAVVQVAVGVGTRVAVRAGGHAPAAAAVPAALVMMTAGLVATLAIAMAAIMRGAL